MRLFLECCGQWRFLPMGEIIGLDYMAVDVVMRRNDYENSVFKKLQRIEQGALSELSKKRAHK